MLSIIIIIFILTMNLTYYHQNTNFVIQFAFSLIESAIIITSISITYFFNKNKNILYLLLFFIIFELNIYMNYYFIEIDKIMSYFPHFANMSVILFSIIYFYYTNIIGLSESNEKIFTSVDNYLSLHFFMYLLFGRYMFFDNGIFVSKWHDVSITLVSLVILWRMYFFYMKLVRLDCNLLERRLRVALPVGAVLCLLSWIWLNDYASALFEPAMLLMGLSLFLNQHALHKTLRQKIQNNTQRV